MSKGIIIKKLIIGVIAGMVFTGIAVFFLVERQFLMSALLAYGGYELLFRSYKRFKELSNTPGTEPSDEPPNADNDEIECLAEGSIVGDDSVIKIQNQNL